LYLLAELEERKRLTPILQDDKTVIARAVAPCSCDANNPEGRVEAMLTYNHKNLNVFIADALSPRLTISALLSKPTAGTVRC